MRRLILLLLFFPISLLGQSLRFDRQLVLRDSSLLLPDCYSTSLESPCRWATFDADGGWSIITGTGRSAYFIGPNDTIGPLDFYSGGSNGVLFEGPGGVYVKQYGLVPLIGPVPVSVAAADHPRSGNDKHMAAAAGDSITIYIDGVARHRIDTFSTLQIMSSMDGSAPRRLGQLETKLSYFDANGVHNWLRFSDNGQYIATFENGGLWRVVVDGTTIDSAKEEVYVLGINGRGEHLYATTHFPPSATDATFFIHAGGTVVGPLGPAWNSWITSNGAYYVSGPDYIIVNGRLHKGIANSESVQLADERNSLYIFTKSERENAPRFLRVNGKEYPLARYKEIYAPTIDSTGRFAYFGMRGDNLHPVVDGKERRAIDTRGGLATPIHISPRGDVLYSIVTDEATYIYRNDSLLLPPLSAGEPFEVRDIEEEVISREFAHGRPHVGWRLDYMRYGDLGYVVRDGKVGPPMPAAITEGDEVGSVLASGRGEKWFYIFQRLGDRRVLLNYNNVLYTFEDMDEVLWNSMDADEGRIVFYGRTRDAIYRYSNER